MALKQPVQNLLMNFKNAAGAAKSAYFNLGPVKAVYSPMTAVTGSDATYDAMAFLTGIKRTVTGTVTDTTPTAALLVTAASKLLGFDLANAPATTDTVFNAMLSDGTLAIDTVIGNTGNNTITLAAGTGVTIVGDESIVTDQSVTIRVHFTSATAVTMYVCNPA